MSLAQRLYNATTHTEEEAPQDIKVSNRPLTLTADLREEESSNDRATLRTIDRSGETELNLGGGRDTFVFGGRDLDDDIGAITVDLGAGRDFVKLKGSIEDYRIDASVDGQITITELEDGGESITFISAERFIFDNVIGGVNYTNDSFTAEELAAVDRATLDEVDDISDQVAGVNAQLAALGVDVSVSDGDGQTEADLNFVVDDSAA